MEGLTALRESAARGANGASKRYPSAFRLLDNQKQGGTSSRPETPGSSAPGQANRAKNKVRALSPATGIHASQPRDRSHVRGGIGGQPLRGPLEGTGSRPGGGEPPAKRPRSENLADVSSKTAAFRANFQRPKEDATDTTTAA